MKYRSLLVAAVAATIPLAIMASGKAPLSRDEIDKQTVITFYNAITHGEVDTIRKLGSADYVQHDPRYADKLTGLIAAVQAKPPRPADPPLRFVRVIAGEGYVVTVRRRPPLGSAVPGQEQAMVDIFRVNGDGKVGEHWSYWETFPRAGAPVPPLNGNGYF